jgi:hypothetical protein
MATTLHLGDCQNGCDICATNYHEGQAVCDTCGAYTDANKEELYAYKGVK